MNYAESIHYLYNKLPMFSRSGAKAYKPDLTNTVALSQFVGNPHERIRTVHVAGTNGKGSVSHMLAAICQQNGYKTGLYTSPHLKDFRERIKINGEMIPKSFLVNFVEKTKEITEVIKPSFFELTFVMALDFFADQKVDVAIIETGLGGRLDSTNIITPLLSVITNVGFDHMDILGDTLEKIAFEKAGIIKKNVPAIVGERDKRTEAVFELKAREMNAPLIFADDVYKVLFADYQTASLKMAVQNEDRGGRISVELDLNGIYQKKNVITVLAAVDVLKDHFDLETVKTVEALSQVRKLTGLYGRWEVIHEKPMVVLDVAHNADGIKQLLSQLNELKFNRLHIVFGMVSDKDIHGVLTLLPPNATYYITQAQNARALGYQDLYVLAKTYQLDGRPFAEVNEALNTALENAAPDDLIMVFGSLFVVAEVEQLSVKLQRQ